MFRRAWAMLGERRKTAVERALRAARRRRCAPLERGCFQGEGSWFAVAKLLTGREVAAAMGEDLADRIGRLAEAGCTPCLALVRVGERPDDLSYERTIAKRAEGLGVALRRIVLPETVGTEDVVAVVEQVNDDADVHGCLLFRPLPQRVDERRVCEALDPCKDVDGITSRSLARVFTGSGEGFPPATARACLELLDFYGISVAGRRVAVLGRSLVVGRPLSMLLLARDATVTLCHSRTEDLPAVCREADVVVCATGRARAYGAGFFRVGQVVLDVGINFDEGGLCGDVLFAEADSTLGEAGSITPVPGGLGTVTTGVTLTQVVEAAEKASGLA